MDVYTCTNKGRDRFHWAATPLKPYKVGNISYMTYRYSALYFLRKRQLWWKYPNPEKVIVPCSNAFAHAQSTYFPIKDRRHYTLQLHQFAKLNDICPSYSGANLSKNAQKMEWALNVSKWSFPFFMCKHKQRSDRPEPSPFYVHCTASICYHPFTQDQQWILNMKTT